MKNVIILHWTGIGQCSALLKIPSVYYNANCSHCSEVLSFHHIVAQHNKLKNQVPISGKVNQTVQRLNNCVKRGCKLSCCFTSRPAEASTGQEVKTNRRDRQTVAVGTHLNKGFSPDSGPETQQSTGSSLEQPHAAAEPPALHRAARLQGTQQGYWSVVYLYLYSCP